MTIAVTLKLYDGIVIGADSAASGSNQQGQIVAVWNHANKITNLHKSLPLGFVSWGAGSFGSASIGVLLKDLRLRFSTQVAGYEDWLINESNYTLQDVADRVRQFLVDEHYGPAVANIPAGARPEFGFVVSGYSSGNTEAEVWQCDVGADGMADGPRSVGQEPATIITGGQPEAIGRILAGVDPRLRTVLQTNLGVPEGQLDQAMSLITGALEAPVLSAGMPIQDGIDLVDFLVDLTCRYSHFTFGPSTVGGPTELAVITKHEGFKWVKRKHFYPSELNPGR